MSAYSKSIKYPGEGLWLSKSLFAKAVEAIIYLHHQPDKMTHAAFIVKTPQESLYYSAQDEAAFKAVRAITTDTRPPGDSFHNKISYKFYY
jgi:hypothetical protein